MNENAKTVVISGATSGIGKAAAIALAEAGFHVVIVARNREKCESLRKEIVSRGQLASYYTADLSSMHETRDVAQRIRADLLRLDVLINNAGAWFAKRQEQAEGIEKTFALNHLSYFLLTSELKDLLIATADKFGEARVISVASRAHMDGTIHWDDPELAREYPAGGPGPGWAAYAQSKLMNVMFALSLAEMLEGTGVSSTAVHPGVVVTGFSRNNGLLYRIAAPIRKLFNRRSPDDGAEPAIRLAIAEPGSGLEDPRKVTGRYYGPPCKEEPVNPMAMDAGARERLWLLSEKKIAAALSGVSQES